jgi:hypothetical protein
MKTPQEEIDCSCQIIVSEDEMQLPQGISPPTSCTHVTPFDQPGVQLSDNCRTKDGWTILGAFTDAGCQIFDFPEAPSFTKMRSIDMDVAVSLVFGEKTSVGLVCACAKEARKTQQGVDFLPGYCCMDTPFEIDHWGTRVRYVVPEIRCAIACWDMSCASCLSLPSILPPTLSLPCTSTVFV